MMRIGVFDSGLGGLFVLRHIIERMPQHDYVYLGDTQRVPYGSRSEATIYQFTEQAVNFLFAHDCQLIIIACNTSSARALRKIQQEYLPMHFPKRRVLGVIIPSVETALEHNPKTIGVLGTPSTISSETYIKEIAKRNPKAVVIQKAAPLLVPVIESGESMWEKPILTEYLRPFMQSTPDVLIFGCTHYGMLKQFARELIPSIPIISQEDVIPKKLQDYLKRHPEIENTLTQGGSRQFFVTDLTPRISQLAAEWFLLDIDLSLAAIDI